MLTHVSSAISSRTSGPVYLAVSCLMLLLILSSLSECAPVTSEQAASVVKGWLAFCEKPLMCDMGEEVADVKTYEDASGLALYHVVYLKPKGYVLVSADDSIEPIIAFSSDGVYVLDDENAIAALIENDMRGRLAEVLLLETRSLLGDPTLLTDKRFSAARNKWTSYCAAASIDEAQPLGLSTLDDIRVPILCQTRWDQRNVCSPALACYNYYTPPGPDGSTGNYYCGCVATAMAQLIRYHEYPAGPIGTRTFNIKVDGGDPQPENLRGGDGAGGPYNYDLMVYEPHNECGTLTLAQRQAIGALTHDTGTSMQTSYSGTISTAATGNVAWALVEVFQYTNAVSGANGDNDIGSGLDGMIIPNLDGFNPVVLGLSGGPGGHAVVCDGYGYNGGTLYYHINCGWSGQSDAWYNLPTVDTHLGTFDTVHTCCYNVFTSGSGLELISGRVTGASGDPMWNMTVQAQKSGGGTYTALTEATGTYAIKVPPDSTFDVTVVGSYYKTQTVSTGISQANHPVSGNVFGVDFSPKAVKVDPGTIWATEGDTVEFDVWLNQDPEEQVTVTVTGDTDAQILQPASGSLTFNSDNWDDHQTVRMLLTDDTDAQHNYGGFHFILSATEWTCPFIVLWITDDDRAIETNTAAVSVPEGATAQFMVRLMGQPASDVTVDVARSSGDEDISVQSGSSLVFSTTTWNNYQTVTLFAAEDTDQNDGTAVISCTSSSWTSADVTATELDNDPDSDGDGLPDDWEQQIVDDDPSDEIDSIDDVLPGDDYDGDGRTNEEEWIANTDPTDETSYLAFIAVSPVTGSSSVMISWTSNQERSYSVFFCDEPLEGAMAWCLAEGNIPGSGAGTDSWIDDGSITGIPPNEVAHRFYIVEVHMPQ